MGCVFHEVFGVERGPLLERLAALPRMVEERLGTWPSAGLAYAPSPHTLYTTHADVVRRLVEQGTERGLRLSLHLAEHASERRFLETGDGPIATWYEQRLRVRRDLLEWPGQSPIAFADSLGALAAERRGGAPHRRAGPRSSSSSRDAALRWCSVRGPTFTSRRACRRSSRCGRRGSRPASAPTRSPPTPRSTCSSEARALSDRFSSVPAADLVAMATWGSARALGLRDVGRIAPGTRPGLFAIDGEPGTDPCAFVLRNVRAPRRWLARRVEPST